MKRCICGTSARYPVCDGSHADAGWKCAPDGADEGGLVIAASASLQSIADRLAHEFSGRSLTAPVSGLHADRLVVLTDGQDLPGLQGRLQGVTARRRTLIPIGLAETVAAWAFDDFEVAPVGDVPDSALWSAVVASMQAAPAPAEASPVPAVFLSHAVADEPRLTAVVNTLRRDFGVRVFLCADSIRSGSEWQAAIHRHLGECDVFVFVASEAANDSVFCAFEAGYALARNTPVRVIDIDGRGPPAHLSHLHAESVPRQKAVQPWLNNEELVLDCFLKVLAHDEPGARGAQPRPGSDARRLS
jgi:hypothetical protein